MSNNSNHQGGRYGQPPAGAWPQSQQPSPSQQQPQAAWPQGAPPGAPQYGPQAGYPQPGAYPQANPPQQPGAYSQPNAHPQPGAHAQPAGDGYAQTVAMEAWPQAAPVAPPGYAPHPAQPPGYAPQPAHAGWSQQSPPPQHAQPPAAQGPWPQAAQAPVAWPSNAYAQNPGASAPPTAPAGKGKKVFALLGKMLLTRAGWQILALVVAIPVVIVGYLWQRVRQSATDRERYVYIVNPLPNPVTVSVNGKALGTLAQWQSQRYDVDSGHYAVVAEGNGKKDEGSFDVPQREGALKGMRGVYNIGGKARYSLVTAHYGNGTVPSDYVPVGNGARFFVVPSSFTGIPDTKFADSIETERRGTVNITHLCHIDDDDNTPCDD